MPRFIIGAVTMKTRRRTSTTSTSGVTLMSAIIEPLDRERSVRYVAAAPAAAAPPPSWPPVFITPVSLLREVPLDDVQELQREVVHHRREHLDAARVEVVEEGGGDRRGEAHRGGDERLRDARR